MGLLARLRIATLLAVLAGPPLLAFSIESGLATWSYWQADVAFDKVLATKALALAGIEIARALPAEAFAPPAEMAAARAKADQAFEVVAATYQNLRVLGDDDATLARDAERIATTRAAMATYREHVDKNEPDVVAIALGTLQPASGAGLDMVRRLSAKVDDFAIARYLAGLHALLQFNDATLISVRPGAALMSKGALDSKTYAFVLHGENLRQTYAPILRELLPPEIVAVHDAFEASPDGQFLAKGYQRLSRNEAGDATEADRWTQLSMARVALSRRLIETAIEGLETLTQARKSALHDGFLFRGALSLGGLGLGVALCLAALSTLRGLFHAIAARMRGLAEGDKTSPIPLSERSDDLGEIARALEVFRRAAIRNDELEAASLAERAAADAARRDAQIAAEREAEAWMETTTRAFAEGLHRLASGDLGFEMNEKLAAQFERLREDFNISVRKLRQTLQSVGEAAETVGGRSAEISGSADRLAAATARQSAALGETSATLGAITANVEATAARAGEARASVGDTRARADRADAVMLKTIAAMETIEAAAKQIAQINGVVDEIAFQTNLLALNAGVEAARAGEAGRGFAVVAQEVRELALRSAEAAKEINQLVGSTGRSIGEGVKLVRATGEELRAIGERVMKVDQHVQAIAEAARAQAKTLSDVTGALADIDRSTRESADMVQDLNTAGAALAAESEELNQMMSRFQVAEAGARRARAA